LDADVGAATPRHPHNALRILMRVTERELGREIERRRNDETGSSRRTCVNQTRKNDVGERHNATKWRRGRQIFKHFDPFMGRHRPPSWQAVGRPYTPQDIADPLAAADRLLGRSDFFVDRDGALPGGALGEAGGVALEGIPLRQKLEL
jgi:hypothetical protein